MKSSANTDGVSALIPIFLLLLIVSLSLSAILISTSGQRAVGDITRATSDFYSANSGLEWVRQVTDQYTTSDQAKWEALNGKTVYLEERADGPQFTITINYQDQDNDPATDDTVKVTSTGSYGGSAKATSRRTVAITLDVPVSTGFTSFIDDFDQPDTASLDINYHFGRPSSAHGFMIPFYSSLSTQAGDIDNLVTHSSEFGGAPGVLRIGGFGEVRVMINTGACFKWSRNGTVGVCDYTACKTSPDCQAQKGLDIPADSFGYQNYFVKIRARLVSGDGFGIYFRSLYPFQNDPSLVDFGGLTGYIWQYDPALGYVLPCGRFSAIAGNNGAGMLVTRRVDGGSETCGANCVIYATKTTSGKNPFFCPENRTGLADFDGWRWRDLNWITRYRTIYIYVYQKKVKVYVGREEISGVGGENQPEQVGSVELDSVGAMLAAGGIGIRVWNGSVAEFDYIKIYRNDNHNGPTTFPGS